MGYITILTTQRFKISRDWIHAHAHSYCKNYVQQLIHTQLAEIKHLPESGGEMLIETNYLLIDNTFRPNLESNSGIYVGWITAMIWGQIRWQGSKEETACVASVGWNAYMQLVGHMFTNLYIKMEDEQKLAVKYIKEEMTRTANCGR